MSYLKILTDADQAMRASGAGPCMHIQVAYSTAAEVAKLADLGKALQGWSAKRVATAWDEPTAWMIESLSDSVLVEDSDVRYEAELLRQLAQALAGESPAAPAAPKPEPIFLVWTDADSRAAVAEGWDVWEVSGMVDRNHLAIQRVDERNRFASDAEAVLHVYDRAVRDLSQLHRKALAVTLQAKP